MKKIKKMSDAERHIMEIIWSNGRPTTTREILEKLPEDIEWKQSTVVTFLARLIEKGILKATRISKANHYEPCMSEQEYLDFEMKKFIKSIRKETVLDFIKSLCKSGDLTLQDIESIENDLKKSEGSA